MLVGLGADTTVTLVDPVALKNAYTAAYQTGDVAAVQAANAQIVAQAATNPNVQTGLNYHPSVNLTDVVTTAAVVGIPLYLASTL